MNRKRKQKRMIAIIVAAVVLFGALGFFAYQYKVNTDEIKALNEELNTNTQTVYIATKEIVAGEKITEDNVAKQSIISGLESYFYISSTELGSTAMVDIAEGTPITFNMVTDVDFATDSREYQISVANIMTDQADYDTIDVRIMFPNGEDYLILSKKNITNLNLEGCVFNVVMNEEEILRMASATIDAYQTTGAYIYTTRYVADSQEEATPTYLTRAETIDLINSDPNVLTRATETLNLSARLSLESRLTGLTEEQLGAAANGWDISDNAGGSTAQSSVIGDTYSQDTEETTEDVEEGSSSTQSTRDIADKEADLVEESN